MHHLISLHWLFLNLHQPGSSVTLTEVFHYTKSLPLHKPLQTKNVTFDQCLSFVWGNLTKNLGFHPCVFLQSRKCWLWAYARHHFEASEFVLHVWMFFIFRIFHSCYNKLSPSPQAAKLKGNTLSQINQITSLQLASCRFLWSHRLVFSCKTNVEQSSTALPAFLTWCRVAHGPWKRPCPGGLVLSPPPAQSHTGEHCLWAHQPGSAEKRKVKGEVSVSVPCLC